MMECGSRMSASMSLFMTVNDSLVARNLSGQSKKVGCGCPHYFREINSQYLKESQKIVYMILCSFIRCIHTRDSTAY
jgi:hypothetical protein